MCCNAVWTFNVLLSGQYLCTSDIANSARLLPRRVNTSSKTLPPVSVNVAGPELVITSFRFWSRTFSSRCYTYLLFEYLQFSHECRCHDARFCCVDPELDFRKKNQRSRARRESLMPSWVNSLFVESLDEKKKWIRVGTHGFYNRHLRYIYTLLGFLFSTCRIVAEIFPFKICLSWNTKIPWDIFAQNRCAFYGFWSV